MYLLQDNLLQETLRTSRFEDCRNYVSLSNIIKPIDELINDFRNGYSASTADKIKCRLGYHMEDGLKQRLLNIDGVENSFEIVVPQSGGLIKGHTDFTYHGLPGDCKSFARDDYMPKGRVSSKIFWQLNAYMLYMDKSNAWVVAESRESGLLEVIQVNKSLNTCNQIHYKVQQIIKLLSQTN